MDHPQFVEIIREHMLPLFLGATVAQQSRPAKKSKLLVAQDGAPSSLALKFSPKSAEQMVIQRSHGFLPDERALIAHFIESLPTDPAVLKQFGGALLRICTRNAIARIIDPTNTSTVAELIELFESLAGRTYEGHNLALGIGLDNNSTAKGTLHFRDLLKNDFGLVLSDGISTLVVANSLGIICDHTHIDAPVPPSHAPVAFAAAAAWADESRSAFILNRNGEILVFKNRVLLFSRRRNRWQYYPHSSIVKQIAAKTQKAWTPELREAIYDSALDVSFARTGGLIALIKRPEHAAALAKLAPADLPKSGSTAKSKYVSSAELPIFPTINRRIRKELLSIDGATVLNYDGKPINIGAIVIDVKPSADGGARTAAARSLSMHGIALKISMDGEVRAYHKEDLVVSFG